MVDTEREILREREEHDLGERMPWDSNRQATYEDSVPADADWDEDRS